MGSKIKVLSLVSGLAGGLLIAPTPGLSQALQGADAAVCLDAKTASAQRIAACDRYIASGIARTGDLADAQAGRAEAYYQAKRYDAAIAGFAEAERTDPAGVSRFAEAYSWALLDRGNLRKGQNDSGGAIADYSEAIRLAPGYAKAYANRAVIRRFLGQQARALADHDRAVELDPNSALNLVGRGTTYWHFGDYVRARADLDQAIQVDGASLEAYWTRGALQQRLGDHLGAVADLDRAYELKQGNTVVMLLRAKSQIALGNYNRAAGDIIAVHFYQPGTAESYAMLGQAEQGAGRPERALAAFDQALALDPRNALALRYRSVSLAALNDRQQAQAAYTAQMQADAAAERDAAGRLIQGLLTAAAGGNAGQVGQALAGQQITIEPPPAPSSSRPSSSGSRSPTPASAGGDSSLPEFFRLRSLASCVSYAFQRKAVGGHVYRVTNGCSENLNFALGVYVNGVWQPYQNSGGTLTPAQSKDVTVEVRGQPGTTVKLYYACITKEAAELSLGPRMATVGWWANVGECRAYPLRAGSVGTAR